MFVGAETTVTDCKLEAHFRMVATRSYVLDRSRCVIRREPYRSPQRLSAGENRHRLRVWQVGPVDRVRRVADRFDATEIRAGGREDMQTTKDLVGLNPHPGQARGAIPPGKTMIQRLRVGGAATNVVPGGRDQAMDRRQ